MSDEFELSTIFSAIAEHAHEQLVFCYEPSSGYRGIIAIHDTTLGPALGGTRFWSYASDAEAVIDVLRLARAMTYKASVAGLNLGGGKAVIIGDPRTTHREAIFRAHGRFIESLGGRYITAEDVGTTSSDMEFIRTETSHVTGLPGASGTSPVTAFGTYQGMKAAALTRLGSDSLADRTVAVQGVGAVGYHLCRHLHAEGARLVVSDLVPERVQKAVEEFGAEPVDVEAIYLADVDIYAPCALGATINDETIDRLKVSLVAGAANNVLAEPRHGDLLHERDILYAPDYVINAGGVINVYGELQGWSSDRVMQKAGEIYTTLLRIFKLARDEGIPTYRAADRIAEKRIEDMRALRKAWV